MWGLQEVGKKPPLYRAKAGILWPVGHIQHTILDYLVCVEFGLGGKPSHPICHKLNRECQNGLPRLRASLCHHEPWQVALCSLFSVQQIGQEALLSVPGTWQPRYSAITRWCHCWTYGLFAEKVSDPYHRGWVYRRFGLSTITSHNGYVVALLGGQNTKFCRSKTPSFAGAKLGFCVTQSRRLVSRAIRSTEGKASEAAFQPYCVLWDVCRTSAAAKMSCK